MSPRINYKLLLYSSENAHIIIPYEALISSRQMWTVSEILSLGICILCVRSYYPIFLSTCHLIPLSPSQWIFFFLVGEGQNYLTVHVFISFLLILISGSFASQFMLMTLTFVLPCSASNCSFYLNCWQSWILPY